MRRLLVLLLLTSALHAETYRDETCGVQFELLRGWTAGNRATPAWQKHYLKDGQVRCNIGIRPTGWVRKAAESDGFLRDYAIEILVADAPFDALARISFFKTDEGWRTHSRGLDSPAEELITRCCRGLRGSGWSRVWNKEGEVGSESFAVAVLNDRKQRSAFFYVQQGDLYQADLRGVIKTFRFIR